MNFYSHKKVLPSEVVSKYSGMRPILRSGFKKLNAMSRDTLIEKENRLINIFGGRWTTALLLTVKVLNLIS